MPKCPNCKKEINELVHIRSGWTNQNCGYNFNSETLDYDSFEFSGDDNVCHYDCPECEAELFSNEQEVIKFFKGKNG